VPPVSNGRHYRRTTAKGTQDARTRLLALAMVPEAMAQESRRRFDEIAAIERSKRAHPSRQVKEASCATP